MKSRVFEVLVVALLISCGGRKKYFSPTDQLYFPSGIAHVRSSPTSEGTLYVVSSNFDLQFDTGGLIAIDLDAVGLPAFGTPRTADVPPEVDDLKVDPSGSGYVWLASFGADMGVQTVSPDTVRLFIPSRSDGHKLMAVEAKGTQLKCLPIATDGVVPESTDPRDCGQLGASLVAEQGTKSAVPRAQSPMMATVSQDGSEVWVTSGRHADSPRFSASNFIDYVVRMPTSELSISKENFLGIGPGSTHAVVAGKRWTYFSGRRWSPGESINPPLVRMIDGVLNSSGTRSIFDPGLQSEAVISEAHGLAISSNEDRLYIGGGNFLAGAAGNDALVVASINGATNSIPMIRLLSMVPLPESPEMIKTISRGAGRGDLVVIACGKGNRVVIYDEDLGEIVAQLLIRSADPEETTVPGSLPSSFAIDRRPTGGVRIYVTNFVNGRISVIDVPDLDRAHTAQLVAYLGRSQKCLSRNAMCSTGATK